MTRVSEPIGLAAMAIALVAAAPADPPTTLFDPRLTEVRLASVSWQMRTRKIREVADVVCLVSDMPGYLAAISAWDRDHAFPVLFDDSEYCLKFLKAFRPARVLRLPIAATPIPEAQLWQAMEMAVGRSWRAPRGGALQTGDQVPEGITPNVPGMVFSSPTSPSLAGAVALAAGRFEPILRWEPGKKYGDTLTKAEANFLAGDLENRVAVRFPRHDRLGDDCDFVTLAGDYPYAYEIVGGPWAGLSAFDDRVGFDKENSRRWAYAGRLMGDEAASTYRAMCALFLEPESVAMIDTYDDRAPAWSAYALPSAEDRFRLFLPATSRSGPEAAGPEGWRRFFAAGNPFGLLLINSSGSPDRFTLRGGQGGLADVPESAPCIVHKIHSFSAADPRSAETLAGRWIDGGAYVYFGAMNEPFLAAFRTPTLVADLVAEGLPLSAAFRQGQGGENFPGAWRMVYLGDPLCSVTPPADRRPRVSWDKIAEWPTEIRPSRVETEDDEHRLSWARSDSILRASLGEPVGSSDLFLDVLLSIRRDRLKPASRAVFDALLATSSPAASRAAEVKARLEAIPPMSRSRAITRALDRGQISRVPIR